MGSGMLSSRVGKRGRERGMRRRRSGSRGFGMRGSRVMFLLRLDSRKGKERKGKEGGGDGDLSF